MKRLSWQLKTMAALAAVHAVLVACGSASFLLYRFGAVGQVLAYYSVLTGAERGFGFFAPTVTDQPRAHYQVWMGEGAPLEGNLEDGLTSESAIRVGHFEAEMYMAMRPGEEEARRAMIASVAGKVFARYPQAQRVRIALQAYELVSMDEYRRGERAQWKTLYEAEFLPPVSRL